MFENMTINNEIENTSCPYGSYLLDLPEIDDTDLRDSLIEAMIEALNK